MWKRQAAKLRTNKAKRLAKPDSSTSSSQQPRFSQATTGYYSEPFTYIHKGTHIVGNINVAGRARIHGMLHGNLEVTGLLEIAESASIEGSYIHADSIKIIGTVQTDVWAHGKVEIWRTGKLVGNIYAASLDIEEGASFVGSSDINPAGYHGVPDALKAHVTHASNE